MESDFLREYGMDLNTEVFGGEMSYRRFSALIKGLSPNSSFAYFVADKDRYKVAAMNLQIRPN